LNFCFAVLHSCILCLSFVIVVNVLLCFVYSPVANIVVVLSYLLTLTEKPSFVLLLGILHTL